MPVCDAARRPLRRRRSCSTARSRRRAPERWPRASRSTAREGYRKFQLKVGGDPDEDIARIRAVRAQAAARRTCWSPTPTPAGCSTRRRAWSARSRTSTSTSSSPASTYEECLAVRRRTEPSLRARRDDRRRRRARCAATPTSAMDVVNLKISKVGGLTKARQIRDLCVSLGIAMTIEDTWGGDITTAAIAHLAHCTPSAFRFTRDRLQQLRDREHGRGRAEAQAGPDGRLDRAGARRAPARQGAGPAARRGDGAPEALSLSDRARSPLPGRPGGRATARRAPCRGGTTGAATDRRAGRSRPPPAASTGRPRAPRPSRGARLRRA